MLILDDWNYFVKYFHLNSPIVFLLQFNLRILFDQLNDRNYFVSYSVRYLLESLILENGTFF